MPPPAAFVLTLSLLQPYLKAIHINPAVKVDGCVHNAIGEDSLAGERIFAAVPEDFDLDIVGHSQRFN